MAAEGIPNDNPRALRAAPFVKGDFGQLLEEPWTEAVVRREFKALGSSAPLALG